MPNKNQISTQFLGGVKITWKNRVLTQFATQKVLGLFCYLLDNPEKIVSRDSLMTMFWSESPENQARYNLRHALWNIRKLFKTPHSEFDPLVANRNSCQINQQFRLTSDCVDLIEFAGKLSSENRIDSLNRAVSLYKGSFLEGFTLKNLPLWEEWLFHRREELRNKFLDASVELGKIYLNAGEPGKALEPFMRALATAPDLEPAHEGVIRAYANQGKTSAALRQYSTYVNVMEKTYDAPPRKELEELVDSLRNGRYEVTQVKHQSKDSEMLTDLNDLSMPASLLVKSQTDSIISLPTLKKPVAFVGRKNEITMFRHLLSDVMNGSGQALIVSGEMGIGKTRLFQQFIELVPKSFIVGMGESQEIISTQPFPELFQIARMFGQNTNVSRELKADLESLLDEYENVNTELESYSESIFLEKLLQWVVRLARQSPIVLAIDDLHWAGDAVLNFFSMLAVEVKNLPMLLVGIFRTFELQSEDSIASSLISIARTGRLWRIKLDNLSSEETKLLISLKSGESSEILSDDDLDRLYKYSAGIPLYALELAHFLEDGKTEILESPILNNQPDFELARDEFIVPPLMRNITSLRLSRLPEKYVELLRVTSLILNYFSFELISYMFPMENEELEDILIDLEHRNFLHHHESGAQLQFMYNHQMMKQAIRDTIPHLERRRLYKSINRSLDQTDTEVSSDVKAHYLYHSGDKDLSVPYLLASAKMWLGFGDKKRGLHYSNVAFDTANELFMDKPDLFGKIALAHADNLQKTGYIKAAIDVYNITIGKIEKRDDDKPTDLLNRRDQLRELLKIEPARSKQQLPPLALVSTKRSLANIKVNQGDLESAEKLLGDAGMSLDKLPNSPITIRETGMVLQVRAKYRIGQQKLQDAAVLLENALELLKREGLVDEIIESYHLLGQTYYRLGMLQKADDIFVTSQNICTEVKNMPELIYCLHNRALISFDNDDLSNAERLLNESLDLADDLDELTTQKSVVRINLGIVKSKLGNKSEAEQIFAEEDYTLKEGEPKLLDLEHHTSKFYNKQI